MNWFKYLRQTQIQSFQAWGIFSKKRNVATMWSAFKNNFMSL